MEKLGCRNVLLTCRSVPLPLCVPHSLSSSGLSIREKKAKGGRRTLFFSHTLFPIFFFFFFTIHTHTLFQQKSVIHLQMCSSPYIFPREERESETEKKGREGQMWHNVERRLQYVLMWDRAEVKLNFLHGQGDKWVSGHWWMGSCTVHTLFSCSVVGVWSGVTEAGRAVARQ